MGTGPGGVRYIGPPMFPGAERSRNTVSPVATTPRAISARPVARPRCPLVMGTFVMRTSVMKATVGRLSSAAGARRRIGQRFGRRIDRPIGRWVRGWLRHVQEGQVRDALETA